MKVVCIAVLSILATIRSAQQKEDWKELLDRHQNQKAMVLCRSWTSSPDLSKRVEAEKCLANIELEKGQVLNLQGNDSGGGSLGAAFTPEAAKAALVHLDKGISLAPQDLSIHQGRLHVLEAMGWFSEMNRAVDQSADFYKGLDALKSWLAYDSELADMGQAKAGLEFAEVLDRRYPNQHDVIGNIGAFHNMLHEPRLALPYLRRAVELAPNDAMDNWNLGWALDHLDQIEEADKWMARAIALDPESKSTPGCKCLYAEFVEKKLHQGERACALEKAGCEADRQTACTASKPAGSKR